MQTALVYRGCFFLVILVGLQQGICAMGNLTVFGFGVLTAQTLQGFAGLQSIVANLIGFIFQRLYELQRCKG